MTEHINGTSLKFLNKSVAKGKYPHTAVRIKILNAEHSIGLCNVEGIPEWVTKYGPAKDVTFFYCHERDWIVLNKDNANYEFYKMIVEKYLSLDDEGKLRINEIARKTNINVYKALRCLNWIIRVRRKLYKSMRRKRGAKND